MSCQVETSFECLRSTSSIPLCSIKQKVNSLKFKFADFKKFFKFLLNHIINNIYRMSFAQVFVAFTFATVLMAVCVQSTQGSAQAPLCQPGIVDEMPQHIKKVCVALENSEQLTTALRSYINNEASALVANSDDLSRNFNKRTDVDHVFLRFGKRR